MIYPTMQDLTKGKYNRYELAIATAKGARKITDEYVRQRAEAEAAAGGGKDSERPAAVMIDKKLKDEKAVKISIDRIADGEFVICEEAEEALAKTEETAESEEVAETEETAETEIAAADAE
jgi:DNA-directed RNA polymerase subunit K/omega